MIETDYPMQPAVERALILQRSISKAVGKALRGECHRGVQRTLSEGFDRVGFIDERNLVGGLGLPRGAGQDQPVHLHGPFLRIVPKDAIPEAVQQLSAVQHDAAGGAGQPPFLVIVERSPVEIDVQPLIYEIDTVILLLHEGSNGLDRPAALDLYVTRRA